MIKTYIGAVFSTDCDELGQMHVRNYVGKFEEATRQLIGSIGFTPEYMRDNDKYIVQHKKI